VVAANFKEMVRTDLIKCRHANKSGEHARTKSVKEKEREREGAGRERARARDGEVRGTKRVGERVEEVRERGGMREGEWGKEGREKTVEPCLAVDRQDPLSHCKLAGSGWGMRREVRRYPT